jgi:hypothetical protein
MWCAKLISGVTKKTKKPKVSWMATRNNPPIYFVDHPSKPDHIPANGVEKVGDLHYQWHKKNGRFLPAWASRITLEIVSVRVERLQEISRGDAMAEGCPFANMADGPNPRDWYAELWESINGPGSWDANPFVWVVEFRRVEK